MSASEHHTLESFRSRFPALDTDEALVQASLDAAAQETPPSVWREHTREGHGLLAAHLLTMTEFGKDARLASNDAQSTYGVLRRRLERRIAPSAIRRTAL